MVREIVNKPFTAEKAYKEIYCLSTDSKPDGGVTGSLLLEVDTGKLYVWDEVTPTWVLMKTIKE